MQNDANQAKENVAQVKDLGAKLELIETSLNLADRPTSKILSVSACFVVDNTEVLLGEVDYGGTLTTNFIVEEEDGSIKNLTAQSKLNGKFENDEITTESGICVVPNIISNEIERNNNDNVKLRTNVELNFHKTANNEVDVYLGGDEDVFVKQEETGITAYVGKNCINFTENVELDSKFKVENVLSISSGAILKKADSLESLLIFEGEIFVRALVTLVDEKNKIMALYATSNFREEYEDGNAKKESEISAAIKVVCPDVTSTIKEDGLGVTVSLPLTICYRLFEKKNITTVVDAYSSKTELNLDSTSLLASEFLGSENFEFKFDGNITLEENLPRMDKIIAVDGAYITLTNTAINNDELLVEGIIHATVIYLNDDDTLLDSVEVEIPFSQTERLQQQLDNANVNVSALIVDVDATCKRGRELYIDGKFKLRAEFFKDRNLNIVSTVTKGEEFTNTTSSIEIYFATAGQTLWDIAKDLKVSEEILKLQNPDKVELNEGDKIVYYNQKIVEID